MQIEFAALTTVFEQCTNVSVQEDNDVELCQVMVTATISSESDRSRIDPEDQSAVVMDYDNEGISAV